MSTARVAPAAPRLWVHLIGPMQAVDGQGNSVLPRSRKARAVLAILALASPRPVSRARVTGLLWSQREREQGRGSLRQCVHEIQGLLQPLGTGLLEADREQLRLVEDAFWLDIRDARTRSPGTPVEDLVGLDPAFDAWIREEWLPQPPQALLHRGSRLARLGVRHLRAVGGSTADLLADGLGEDIAAALSRFRWLPVIAPEALDHRTNEADVEYLMDGTVRALGDRIRVALRVQDMRSTGEVVWARNFDGTTEDLMTFHDEVVAQAAAQVDAEMLLQEGTRATEKVSAGDTTASVLTLAAVPGIFRLDREPFVRAGEMLEAALAAAPDSAMAHAWFAHWHVMALGQGWATDPKAAINRAGELSRRALLLDPSDARALTIAGHVRGFLDKEADQALVLHERALALNPSLSWAWMMSGLASSYEGNHLDAIRRIGTARRLSPFDPQAFFFDMSLMMPYLMLGDYERAAELGRLTAQIKPSFSSSWKGLLAALGHLGRTGEAANALGRLQALEPGFTVRAAMERSPLRRPEDRTIYATGLRLGGLEE